jgi:hypothetical protein
MDDMAPHERDPRLGAFRGPGMGWAEGEANAVVRGLSSADVHTAVQLISHLSRILEHSVLMTQQVRWERFLASPKAVWGAQ